MSILEQLNRIENAKSSLVNTAKEWGLITEEESNGIKIETVAAEYAGVTVQPSTDVTVDVQDSYTVDAGYYPNGFTVANAIQSVISQDNVEIEEGNAETFSAGYYPNAFVVTAKSGEISPEETPGTAKTGDILLGKTAWVNGAQITGTMPDNKNVSIRLYTDSGAYDVPEGYHAGGGSVSVAAEAGTYTIKATDLENTTFVINPDQAGTSSPNYYLTKVTVNTSAIEARLAAI